ncbi:hypothetical protein [Lactobacillus crispatus]|uniref:hypothetical protein n=1 Tax=Lactobacillus crispatus TaxID=47770 RepID=UPI0022E5C3AC|nr:hypothetical protein [Lactobacillus crispatus]
MVKMKKKFLKLSISTLILVILCFLLQKITHKNGNFWSIIPIYWASSAAYEFQMNTNVSKKAKLIVNFTLTILAVGLLGIFIYILLHS